MFETGTKLAHCLAELAVGTTDNLVGLVGPHSRFYPPYVLAAMVIAAVAWTVNREAQRERGQVRFLAHLFDPAVYFSASSLVDLKIVLANRIFAPFLGLTGIGATIWAAHATASLFVTVEPGTATPGTLTLAAMTVVTVVASDFTSYWVHRIHHETPWLWPFHKVHHSAETLTPLTFARKHPVYDLLRAISNLVLVGPVQGLLFAAFGVADFATILGVNALYALFFWGGANLRHSHIWLSYGPVLSRILISPAQHQIHHSCAPRHHNKNYGEIFALWDWMFGRLYVPHAMEDLEFGVADAYGVREPQAHPTLVDAWVVPFRESAAVIEGLRKRRRDIAKVSS